MSNSVLQTPKVQKIIDALSAKVSKESMKQEGEKRDVTFDDTTTPPTVAPIKTFLHEPVGVPVVQPLHHPFQRDRFIRRVFTLVHAQELDLYVRHRGRDGGQGARVAGVVTKDRRGVRAPQKGRNSSLARHKGHNDNRLVVARLKPADRWPPPGLA